MNALSSIEFIDLSGVEEYEKAWILNSLHTWDSTVQVPWKRSFQIPAKSTVPGQHLVCNGPPMVSNEEAPHCPSSIPHEFSTYKASSTYTHPFPATCAHLPIQTETPPYISLAAKPSAYVEPNNYTSGNCIPASGSLDPQESIKEKCLLNGVEPLAETDTKTGHSIVEKKSGGKSWASLFGGKTAETTNGTTIEPLVSVTEVTSYIESEADNRTEKSFENDMKYRYDDPVYHRLGEFLADHIIDHRTISLQPRGLINRSNYCYINSILQAVVACPPVYNLLIGISAIITTNARRKLTPVIDNMAKFVKEFHLLPATQRVSRRVDKNAKQEPNCLINCDTPFEPNYIYKMLNGLRSDTFVVEGRQEDAEEFLGCLLNALNDEMLELMKLIGKQKTRSVTEIVGEKEDDKEWQVMGPKNKGCVTRRFDVVQTPVSDIFSGHIRSRLHRSGDKSTDNIQPFFTLQLNIEKVSSVREALEALVCKNQLEGVTSSKTNEEVEAWQQVTIEELPVILVLHLKCFDYQLNGCTKITKALEFPIDLKIDSKLLSSKATYSPKEKQYKLLAVVYHDGKEATKGHYLTDAYHVGYARWLRYDDASVKPVPEEMVLKPQGTRVPYLLFYRRSDSITSNRK